jgi:hypothetical protein
MYWRDRFWAQVLGVVVGVMLCTTIFFGVKSWSYGVWHHKIEKARQGWVGHQGMIIEPEDTASTDVTIQFPDYNGVVRTLRAGLWQERMVYGSKTEVFVNRAGQAYVPAEGDESPWHINSWTNFFPGYSIFLLGMVANAIISLAAGGLIFAIFEEIGFDWWRDLLSNIGKFCAALFRWLFSLQWLRSLRRKFYQAKARLSLRPKKGIRPSGTLRRAITRRKELEGMFDSPERDEAISLTESLIRAARRRDAAEAVRLGELSLICLEDIDPDFTGLPSEQAS